MDAAGKLGKMQASAVYLHGTPRVSPPALADYVSLLHIPHIPLLGEKLCKKILGVHAASPRCHLFKSFSDRAWTAPAREHLITMDGRLLTCS